MGCRRAPQLHEPSDLFTRNIRSEIIGLALGLWIRALQDNQVIRGGQLFEAMILHGLESTGLILPRYAQCTEDKPLRRPGLC